MIRDHNRRIECPYTSWTPTDWGPWALPSLGSWFQCLTTILLKNYFSISTLNFLNSALSHSLASYHQAPVISTTLSAPLKPNFLLCCSQVMPCSPFTIFAAFLWTHSNILYPPVEPKTAHSPWSEAAPMLSVVWQSPLSKPDGCTVLSVPQDTSCIIEGYPSLSLCIQVYTDPSVTIPRNEVQ